MTRMNRHARFLVNDRVRASVELVEQDPAGGGFTLAAIVYGEDKEQARLRAELVAQWMTVEGSRAAIRRRLRWASIYAWAADRYCHASFGRALYQLITWMVGCFVDTDGMGEWLRDTWPSSAVRRRLEGM